MEDYILKEIDKIGQILRAIMQKIGLMKYSKTETSVFEATKVELVDNLDLDLDMLLKEENFIEVLTREYGFNDDNLGKFAELLFDLLVASQDETERMKYVADITAVYKYLDAKGGSFSLDRYYILKELEKYTR